MKGIVHSFQSCKEKLWELKDKVKGKMKKPQEGYQPANELFMEIEMVCRQIEQVEACFQMTSGFAGFLYLSDGVASREIPLSSEKSKGRGIFKRTFPSKAFAAEL